MKKLIVCLTGMPGSGKTVVSEVAREMGLKVYSMGDAVRKEVLRRESVLDWRSVRKTMFKLREEEGPRAVAKLVVKEMRGDEWSIAVVEGVRSLDEVEEFKSMGDVIVLAVHSSPRDRYVRMRARGREGDPKSLEELRRRDLDELSLGLGNVIALADYVIVNDSSLEDLRSRARHVIERIVGGLTREDKS
ncbi:MAG: dephospho-CoA kinase [Thermoprotei archaeon]|nr:MAG: dephospho-CoA kinase [Thermoprotei archaeon]